MELRSNKTSIRPRGAPPGALGGTSAGWRTLSGSFPSPPRLPVARSAARSGCCTARLHRRKTVKFCASREKGPNAGRPNKQSFPLPKSGVKHIKTLCSVASFTPQGRDSQSRCKHQRNIIQQMNVGKPSQAKMLLRSDASTNSKHSPRDSRPG